MEVSTFFFFWYWVEGSYTSLNVRDLNIKFTIKIVSVEIWQRRSDISADNII